jgi:peptidyl-Lys metalloendopeptidase
MLEQDVYQYEVETNAISFEISEKYLVSPTNRFREMEARAAKIVGESDIFKDCSDYREQTLRRAVALGGELAQVADHYLQNDIALENYEEWFGARSDNRVRLVNEKSTAIVDFFDNVQYTFQCDNTCERGVLAYVYPADIENHVITICEGFFYLKEEKGVYSQAGIVIHEISHFNDVAKTKDYAYGKSASLDLAIENPKSALSNADNWRQYAEDMDVVLTDDITLTPVVFNPPTKQPTAWHDPGVCVVPDELRVGDGKCDMDGDYNTADCNWDGGDCCDESCVMGTFYCVTENDCKDPRYSVPKPTKQPTALACGVDHPFRLGNGRCDGGDYNTPECNYDGGDCCEATCKDTYYDCPGPEDFGNCIDPAYAGEIFCDQLAQIERAHVEYEVYLANKAITDAEIALLEAQESAIKNTYTVALAAKVDEIENQPGVKERKTQQTKYNNAINSATLIMNQRIVAAELRIEGALADLEAKMASDVATAQAAADAETDPKKKKKLQKKVAPIIMCG